MSWLNKTSGAGASTRKESTQDLQGKVDAISRSQAVIEFTLDGTIVHADENFCNALGYRLDEVKGKHHSMFVDAATAKTLETQAGAMDQRVGAFRLDESAVAHTPRLAAPASRAPAAVKRPAPASKAAPKRIASGGGGP